MNCKTVRIFDQKKRQLTLDEFGEIGKAYWKDFSNEIEQSIITKNSIINGEN